MDYFPNPQTHHKNLALNQEETKKINQTPKKSEKYLEDSENVRTFAPAKQKRIGSVAQLNRASDYGSEGCGFESRRNHKGDFWVTFSFCLIISKLVHK